MRTVGAGAIGTRPEIVSRKCGLVNSSHEMEAEGGVHQIVLYGR